MTKIRFENRIFIYENKICKAGPFDNILEAQAYAEEMSIIDIQKTIEAIKNHEDWSDENIFEIKKILLQANILKSINDTNTSINRAFLKSFINMLNLSKNIDEESIYKIIINMIKFDIDDKYVIDSTIFLYEAFFKVYVDAKQQARNFNTSHKLHED